MGGYSSIFGIGEGEEWYGKIRIIIDQCNVCISGALEMRNRRTGSIKR